MDGWALGQHTQQSSSLVTSFAGGEGGGLKGDHFCTECEQYELYNAYISNVYSLCIEQHMSLNSSPRYFKKEHFTLAGDASEAFTRSLIHAR